MLLDEPAALNWFDGLTMVTAMKIGKYLFCFFIFRFVLSLGASRVCLLLLSLFYRYWMENRTENPYTRQWQTPNNTELWKCHRNERVCACGGMVIISERIGYMCARVCECVSTRLCLCGLYFWYVERVAQMYLLRDGNVQCLCYACFCCLYLLNAKVFAFYLCRSLSDVRDCFRNI